MVISIHLATITADTTSMVCHLSKTVDDETLNQKGAAEHVKMMHDNLNAPPFALLTLFIQRTIGKRQFSGRNGRYTIRSVGKRSRLAKIPSHARNIFPQPGSWNRGAANLSLLNRDGGNISRRVRARIQSNRRSNGRGSN